MSARLRTRPSGGGPSMPATCSSSVAGNNDAAFKSNPSAVSRTSSTCPASQPRFLRNSAGRITCPLVETRVVTGARFMSRPFM